MFDDVLGGNWSFEFPVIAEASFQPPCDIQETDSHYLVSVDLPGLSKNDVRVELQDNTLRVFGERKGEHTRGRGATSRTERFHGTFERFMTLPANLKAENLEAQFENGVLHIAIPKAEAAKPKQIQIGETKPGFVSRHLGKKEEKAA
jgi:HSP20 family protein